MFTEIRQPKSELSQVLPKPASLRLSNPLELGSPEAFTRCEMFRHGKGLLGNAAERGYASSLGLELFQWPVLVSNTNCGTISNALSLTRKAMLIPYFLGGK